MKKTILTICLACSISAMLGQALYVEYPSIYLKISTGASIPFSKIINGQFTDPLVQYDDNHSYIEYFTTGFFFGQHLGFELNFMNCTGSNSERGRYYFKNTLEERYGENYYITSTNRSPTYDSFIRTGFDKFFVSVMYRVKYERYLVMPKLSFGATSVPLNRWDVILKEKNNNNYLNLSISPDNYTSSYFTVGPGITLGRRVFNQLVLTLDIQYTWFRMDFDYEMITRDMVLNSSSTETFPYRKNIHSMNIGIGLIYNIKYGKILNRDHPSLGNRQ